MKSFIRILTLCLLFLAGTVSLQAQFNSQRALGGLVKVFQAASITDEQMAQYVQASVAQMDAQNKVLPEGNPYVVRLNRLTAGLTDADGIPLNFKVYQKDEINAFACPDGSVRVYTGIMDLLNDDELLGVIGHEIGHVVKRHSKKALKQQLLTGALCDELASANGQVAALTDSQLGAIGQALIGAKYSRKQETQADDCGYEFLKEHRRNPYGMVSAFQKLEAIEQQSGGGAQSSYLALMFSDHPNTQARIEHMQKRCLKDGYTAAGYVGKKAAKAAAKTGYSLPTNASQNASPTQRNVPFTLTPAELPKRP